MAEFKLPALDLSSPATVSRWLKQPGDALAAGEKLLELYSERYDWDIPSPAAGVLQSIVAAEGAQVGAGDELAVVAVSSAPEAAVPAAAPARAARISPLAARIAANRQIDLDRARGSGPDGRVNKDDVLALLETGPGALPAQADHAHMPARDSAPAPAVVTTFAAPREHADSSAGRVQTVTLFITVDMSHAASQREARRLHWQQREGFPLDYLPYVVAAAAAALRSAPLGSLADKIASGIQITVTHAGSVTLLRDASGLNLVGIGRRLHAALEELGDASAHAFMIEDHAPGGALFATGLLSHGALGLLTVGAVHKQAVAIGEALQARATAYFGLTVDPGAVDERRAALFMAELKQLLEAGSFS